MIDIERIATRPRRLLCGTLIAVGMLAASAARADTVLVSDTSFVSGSQSMVYSLTAPGPGSITITLSNLSWPDPLASLSFAFTTATGVLQTGNAGEVTFDLTGAGTYYALVSGSAQGQWNLGLYSLRLTYSPLSTTPVPIPPTLWLLLSGAAVSLGLARPRRAPRPAALAAS
jgi:hypothetical protein